ncbi:unnamed protein product [Haemonchus placei]|uniref:ADH_N_2 domain-containing protein n=1 Tax=Haemonchus placei TaxID=6290 RepID=A0A0N4WVV4_HAEPC|nr:unnamed protein product [Haemonchus placei]
MSANTLSSLRDKWKLPRVMPGVMSGGSGIVDNGEDVEGCVLDYIGGLPFVQGVDALNRVTHRADILDQFGALELNDFIKAPIEPSRIRITQPYT